MVSPARLNPGQPVGAILRMAAIQTIAGAQAIMTDSARAPTATVHDIRRALKRWRALLRLLTPHLGEEARKLRIEARMLARRLAGARDAQAAIDALQDAEEAARGEPFALSPRSLATMLARLEALRASGERGLWTEDLRRDLSAHLAAAAEAAVRWDLDGLTADDVAGLLARTFRRARVAMPESWETAEAQALHELRRRVVEHRYQMELMQPSWPRLGRLWVDEAQRLRTRLGKIQDLAVLAGKTAPHQPLAPWRSRLAPLIAHRQHTHAQAAGRLAARLFVETPKAFRRRVAALWQAGEERP
jgi:CHAD domain-containing protein